MPLEDNSAIMVLQEWLVVKLGGIQQCFTEQEGCTEDLMATGGGKGGASWSRWG